MGHQGGNSDKILKTATRDKKNGKKRIASTEMDRLQRRKRKKAHNCRGKGTKENNPFRSTCPKNYNPFSTREGNRHRADIETLENRGEREVDKLEQWKNSGKNRKG